MQKFLAVTAVCIFVFLGIMLTVRIASGAQIPNLNKREAKAEGYNVQVDNLIPNTIKRFRDGGNTCYFAQSGTQMALSCFKGT